MLFICTKLLDRDCAEIIDACAKCFECGRRYAAGFVLGLVETISSQAAAGVENEQRDTIRKRCVRYDSQNKYRRQP